MKMIKLIKLIIPILIVLNIFSTSVFAIPIDRLEEATSLVIVSKTSDTDSKRDDQPQEYVDTGDYKIGPGNIPYSSRQMGSITGNIFVMIQTAGTVIAFIGIIIIGIKYILGSVEQRAEYKKSMIPYIVGCIFIFTISNIVRIIGAISAQI